MERAHRIRHRTERHHEGPRRPAQIVAKFSFFKDKETIRNSGRLLKGTNYSIQEQFPEEIEQKRKPLYLILRQARRDRTRAVIVNDRLCVDGREVKATVHADGSDNATNQTRAPRNLEATILQERQCGARTVSPIPLSVSCLNVCGISSKLVLPDFQEKYFDNF